MIPDNYKDRITFRKLFENFLAALVFERGLPYTCRELLLRPGQTIYSYLFSEARQNYSKPFYSVIVLTALSTLVLVWIGGTQEFMRGLMAGGDHVLAGKEKSIEMLLFDYPTLLALIWIPINGVIGYLFFRRSGLYLSEHFILNTYLLTMQYLFSLAFYIFIPLIGDHAMMVGPLMGVVYQFVLYYSFFGKRLKVRFTLLRTFAVVILGIFFYMIGVMVIIALWVKLIPGS